MSRSLSLRRRIALDIFNSVRTRLLEDHPLRQLFWECTLRCNLSCRHCGSDCKQISAVKDMPKEDFARVLDSVAAATDPHKVMINITGGEPLCRPDLEECGKMIYEKEFPWGMVTNGLALTPQRYRRLLQCGHFGWAGPGINLLNGSSSAYFCFLPSSVSLPENLSPQFLQTNLVSPKLGINMGILLMAFLNFTISYHL